MGKKKNAKGNKGALGDKKSAPGPEIVPEPSSGDVPLAAVPQADAGPEDPEPEDSSPKTLDSGSDDGTGWLTETDSEEEAAQAKAYIARATARRRAKAQDGDGRKHKRVSGGRASHWSAGTARDDDSSDDEPNPHYRRADGFISFVRARMGVAQRRHAKKAAARDKEDAAIVIQRFYRLLRDRNKHHIRAGADTHQKSGAVTDSWPLGPVSIVSSVLSQPIFLPAHRAYERLETWVLGSRPLEANIEHFHRAILRYMTMLATLLLTALFSQPSAAHAAVNAFQCSAAATALHTTLAMIFQRVEQMQSLSYLRRAKGIRNLRKRRTVASCYHGIATALEVLGNILCAFGTYLIMLYWLKFGAMSESASATSANGNGAAQYWWLMSATGATFLNGIVWGRARRFLPCFRRPDGTARPLADVGFILVLAALFYVVLYYVYRLLPPPPTPAEAAEGQWFGAARAATSWGRGSFTNMAGFSNVPPTRHANSHSDKWGRDHVAEAQPRHSTHL